MSEIEKMSVVLNNARKQFITIQKSELNYRLMLISKRMQRTAADVQRLTQEKASITNEQIKNMISEGTENISLENVMEISYMTSDIDAELSLLELRDEDMDAEMKMIETELKALNAEEDELDKTLNNSIKKEFGTFKD